MRSLWKPPPALIHFRLAHISLSFKSLIYCCIFRASFCKLIIPKAAFGWKIKQASSYIYVCGTGGPRTCSPAGVWLMIFIRGKQRYGVYEIGKCSYAGLFKFCSRLWCDRNCYLSIYLFICLSTLASHVM